MKKEHLSKLLGFLPLIISLLSVGLSFLPIYEISNTSYNIATILSSNLFFIQFKVLLLVLLLLPVLSGVFLMLNKEKYSVISLTLLVVTFTTIILSPSIYEVVIETPLYFDYAMIINLIFLSISVLISLHAFFSGVKFSIKEMVELAILIALAIVFDFFPKIKLSGGAGSIGLTMLPLFVIALRFNFVKSFISGGIIYGLLTCLLDGYGFATYPFDYLMGFGLIAVVSLFKDTIFSSKTNKWQQLILLFIAVLLGGLLRILSSTISSMVIYQYGLIDGLVYNILYIVPSLGLVLLVLTLLFPALKQLNRRYPRIN